MAHKKLSPQGLYYLLLCFLVSTKTSVCISGYVQIEGCKWPFQKLRAERVEKYLKNKIQKKKKKNRSVVCCSCNEHFKQTIKAIKIIIFTFVDLIFVNKINFFIYKIVKQNSSCNRSVIYFVILFNCLFIYLLIILFIYLFIHFLIQFAYFLLSFVMKCF